MTDEHVPIEDLAAYAAGDLDAAAAVAVEAHVLLCEDCRADVAGLKTTATALAAVPHVTMPDDVARRIDESVATDRRAPVGDIVPLAPRRRRPSLSAIAAVAAGLFLVGAIGISLRPHDSEKADTAAFGPEAAPATRRLSSGFAYNHDSLTQTLTRALALTPQGPTADRAAAPGAAAPSPSRVTSYSSTKSSHDAVAEAALAPLESDAARLAACINELRGGDPEIARVPLLVDYGTFAGKPAMVIAFPTLRAGEVRADRIDVYVTGAGCGVTAGGEVLDFQRIPRPSGL